MVIVEDVNGYPLYAGDVPLRNGARCVRLDLDVHEVRRGLEAADPALDGALRAAWQGARRLVELLDERPARQDTRRLVELRERADDDQAATDTLTRAVSRAWSGGWRYE